MRSVSKETTPSPVTPRYSSQGPRRSPRAPTLALQRPCRGISVQAWHARQRWRGHGPYRSQPGQRSGRETVSASARCAAPGVEVASVEEEDEVDGAMWRGRRTVRDLMRGAGSCRDPRAQVQVYLVFLRSTAMAEQAMVCARGACTAFVWEHHSRFPLQALLGGLGLAFGSRSLRRAFLENAL